MKKGINFHSLPKGLPYRKYLELAKAAGYDGIELATRIEGELNLFSGEKDFTAFAIYAEKIGLELFSTISMIFNDYPPTSPAQNIRERCIELVELQLRAANWLGANCILIVPGFVTPAMPYDLAYDYSLDVMRKIAPLAEKYKVHVGIENIWNKFLLSPLEFRDYIDKIGSEYMGNYFDVGNFAYDGYLEQWIRIMGQRIKKVHVKDFKREVGNGSFIGFTDLLCGDVDYKAVMQSLKEIGYNDYLTAELKNYPLAEELLLYNTSAALDRILKM